MPAKKHPLKVPIKFLPRTGETDDSQLPYVMMDSLIANYHIDLADAKIAIGYYYGWKPSRDNKVKLGLAKLCGQFEKQLHGYDLQIILSYDFWHHPNTNDSQRKALLDHELSHPRPIMDPELGMPKRDENGRICYYIRQHDIEDFGDVVRRNGVWKADLESMAQIMAEAWEARQRALGASGGSFEDSLGDLEDEPDHLDDSVESALQDMDAVASYSS